MPIEEDYDDDNAMEHIGDEGGDDVSSTLTSHILSAFRIYQSRQSSTQGMDLYVPPSIQAAKSYFVSKAV
eukprot:1284004-Ditylum_brightwellii.AAC.1